MTTSRRFSRWMGPLRPDPTPRDRLNRVALLAMIPLFAVGTAVTQPLLALGFAGLIAALILTGWMTSNPAQALFATRPDHQGICTFVRHPDVRDADPWVLRAVFEGLADLSVAPDQTFAALPGDSLGEDLGLVDDLSFELDHIAARARRIPPDARDPVWSEVRTVGDLVDVLDNSPRLAGAS